MYFVHTKKIADLDKDAILQGKCIYIDRLGCSFETGISLATERIKNAINFRFDEYAVRGEMTDHLNITSIPGPVFSQNTKSLFEQAGITNFEYYQVTLRDEFPPNNTTDKDDKKKPKPIEYTNYFIANVVGLVDCVDHEKSVLEYFYPPELRDQKKEDPNKEDDINDPFAGENPNDIDFITKLVLDESKVDSQLKVFRLKDQPNLLVFHESIVDLIRKEKLSGFVFVPVSKYTDLIEDDDELGTDSEEAKQKEATK
jgi:hypothetical protein